MKIKEIYNRLKELKFKCTRCSNCCRFTPGVVFLTIEDVESIVNYLKISKDSFFQKYCRNVFSNGKELVALKEKENFDCIFWKDGCLIYEVRPLQCKAYPFWSSIVESDEIINFEKNRCKGIGKIDSLSFKEKKELYLKHKNIKYLEKKI